MKTKLVLFAVLGLACAASYAQQNTVRVGVVHIDSRSKSDDLVASEAAFLTPPSGVNVGDATTLLLGYTRKLTPNLDLDLILGLPPRHKIYGRGALDPLGVIAKVSQASPTLFLNYNFGAETNKFRPFIGAGVNYTHFYNGRTTSAGELGAGGPTKIELEDSWGLALQVGASYKIDQRWSVVSSLAVADVDSELTATTGSIERRTKIDFRPVVFTLTVGYSF